MATKTIAWNEGSGNITVTYGGSGDGTATITSSDNNLYEARSQQITFRTTAGSPQRTVTVTVAQAAKQRIDLYNAIVTAANQTYSGSALTPTPTVTLNGDTVPSTGYDIAYSDNINAGTATITITGKGDYTGTAIGTFTIAKANSTYTAPTAQSLTYNRSPQYLTTTGSTSDGTIQYSSDGSTWGTTRKTGTNAGSYTTYWRLVGDSNHNDVASTSISITIAKATPVINVSPSLVTGLTYNTSAQNLLSGGSVKHSSTDSTVVVGTFTYQEETNAGTYNNPTWAFTPTDTTNYNSISGSVTGSVVIAQATGQVTTLPTARSVTYSGSAQYLVTAGAGTGTMQYRYKLSTSSTWSSWSTTRARSTNAGTYNVQYRAAASADGNYTVSAVGELNVIIAKASRTISFTTAPTSVEIGATITVVATPSAGASDGTITYASSDTSKASVSGNVVTGVALGSCTISATISGGSNYNDATTSYSLGVTEKNYANEYFTIESLEDGNAIVWKCAGTGHSVIYWSSDKASWAAVTPSTSGATITTINKEQKIYIRRTGDALASSGSNYCYFSTSKKYVVSGNIMSLLNGDDFVGTDLTGSNSYAFVRLFNNNTTLVSTEHLILPNSTSDYCYYYMFRGCTSLSVAPKMPATTLSNACYWATYYECSSLPTAPQLPATTLVQNCYGYMFYGCSKLSYIQCLATDISASSCTNNWVDGVAATGTFVKSSSMSSWATGASGIPTGWTTINNTDVIQTIEYLGSTGTQYINTGIVAQGNETIEITFRNTKNQSTCFMGCRTNSSSGKCTIGSGSSSTTIYAALGSSANTTLKSFDQQKHTVVLNTKTGKASIDGGQEISVGSYTINSLPIFVFACNQGGTVSLNSALEVYSCSIGSKVFIPVRVGAVGYLCDTETGVLYANSGTGSFTLGGDVN